MMRSGALALAGAMAVSAIGMVVSPAIAQDAPKVVALSELGLSPRKYAGKPIEVRNLVCYYADVGDYRCVSPLSAPVVVFFTKVLTGAVKQIEQNCDEFEKAMRAAKCRVALRFTFAVEDIEDDQMSGSVQRRIFRPESAEAVAAAGVR